MDDNKPMRIVVAAVAVVIVAWLGLWLSNTGLLVSSGDTKVPKFRQCKYLVGVTVVERIEPLADRCPLLRAVR